MVMTREQHDQLAANFEEGQRLAPRDPRTLEEARAFVQRHADEIRNLPPRRRDKSVEDMRQLCFRHALNWAATHIGMAEIQRQLGLPQQGGTA